MIPGVTVPSSLTLDSAIIRNPLVATPDTLIVEAIEQMAAGKSSGNRERLPDRWHHDHLAEHSTCVIVVDAEQVVGLLTEQDVVRLTAQQLPLTELTLEQVVNPPSVTLPEANCTDAATILALLQQHCTRHLPLVN